MFGPYVEIFRKKYCLALHLVEMDTDPDRQSLDSDPASDLAKR